MAEEEVGLRLSLKNRREVAAGVHQVGDELDRVGDQAAQANRQSRIAARGFAALGRGGHLAARGLAVAAAGVVGLGFAAFKFSSSAISKASDLNETINKSNVIFGKQARSMKRWASGADQALGLSKQAALETAAGFGDMFSQIGYTQKRAAGMSRSVVKMAADFGSFNNLGTEDVLDRISAAMRGEFDSLQAIIPNINAARVQQVAMNQTGKETATLLTAQEKAHATLTILQKDGARAMGDFARTSGGLANQQKILNAEYDNASAKLGRTLMPIQLQVVRFLNNQAMPAFNHFGKWFSREGAPAIGDFLDEARPLAREVIPALGTGLDTVRDTAKDALPYARNLVKAFNDLPDWAKKGAVSGGLGIYASKKLGLGPFGSKSGGGLLGGFTKASPMPVYVVNNGVPLTTGGKPGVTGPVITPEGKPLPKEPGRLKRGGNFVAGAAATIFGPELVQEAKAEFMWPFTEGPFKPKPIKDTETAMQGLHRVFDDSRPSVDGYALQMSGLGSTMRGKTAPATGELSTALGSRLTPRLADASGQSASLNEHLRNQPARTHTSVEVEGLSAANDGVLNLIHNLGNIGNFTAGLAGIKLPKREHGGDVHAGQAYVVGERRAELFVPKVDGFIHPRVPDMPHFDDEDWGGEASSEPLTVQVILDGKVIAENTLNHVRGKLARQ